MTDLLIMPVAALWQQKLRTVLTTLGVVFGAFVLAASLSIGEGVQQTIDRESRLGDISRRIAVIPNWKAVPSKAPADVVVEGRMSPERRERIRKTLEEQNRSNGPERVRMGLSRERLAELAAMEHVRRVVPIVSDSGLVALVNRPEESNFASGDWQDEDFRKRIIFGRGFDSPDQRAVILSEMSAHHLGLVNDSDLQQLIGKPLRLEIGGGEPSPSFNVSIARDKPGGNRDEQMALQQLAWQLPDALDKLSLTDEERQLLRKAIQPAPAPKSEIVSEDFTIIGIYRRATEEELKDYRGLNRGDPALVLPYQTAADFYFREPGRREAGVDQAFLFVDDERNVKAVVKQIEAMGFVCRSALEFIERERLTYILIFGGMTCVAGVALLVSALGIANTMLMSVLERRREIGIMKSVGADNRHLLCVFVIEGLLIGLVGAGSGLLLALAASYPGDTWVRSMVQRDMKIDLKGSIFAFPPWIAATVVIFTVVVTTLAALYPARHAAKVDPVTALRHE